ncbi:TraG/TraD/VirD4 family protein [Thiotrichales bacterium 19S9-12]|nr:TraG/TraD/VirD4 family protein [Thiotrichales bacterium 19S9-11]MCF6812518.1 TraG/TraD/VirD4 family protein [Thiotrichales bacterium 19S9-12]
MYENLLNQLYIFTIDGLNWFLNIKLFSSLVLNMMDSGLLILVSLFAILIISFTNQLKEFSPDAETRPLPFIHRQIINTASVCRYLILGLFIYWLVFNSLLFYATEYENDFSTYDLYLNEYILLFAETLIIYILIQVKFHRLPVIKPFIDRVVMSRLNRISTSYQMNNTSRVIYNPDGKKRETIDYDVIKFIKKGLLFHGLNEYRQPIYTDFLKSLDGHFTIIGGSGMGKGVLTRMYLYQTSKEKVTNIVFDPKPDEYMYNACVDFAHQNKKKMHVVDLDVLVPQISIFKGLTSNQFRDILTSALELQKLKNSNARIWAQRTEMALHKISQQIYEENITPNEIKRALAHFPELIQDSEDTLNLFTYLDDYQIFNTKEGLNLKEIIESGDVLYIRCSKAKTNDVSRQQAQILFTTIFEHINQRDHINSTQCMVVIDEFKFIMNTAIMDNLATIRSQKCSLVFNFQDISNFTTSPNEALQNPNYAQELLSNSHFIAVHNASDIALIKLIQQRCGKKTYHKAYEDDISNAGGSSKTSHERRWTTHDEFKLTENEISSGGKRTAILLSSLLSDNDFARIHTDILKTDHHQFKINTASKLYALVDKKEIAIKSSKASSNDKANETLRTKEGERLTDDLKKNKDDDNFNGFVDI